MSIEKRNSKYLAHIYTLDIKVTYIWNHESTQHINPHFFLADCLSQDKSINTLASNRIHATPIFFLWPNMHVYVEADYMLNTSYKYGYLYWLYIILFQVQNSANTHIYTSNQILTFCTSPYYHFTSTFYHGRMHQDTIPFNFGHGLHKELNV